MAVVHAVLDHGNFLDTYFTKVVKVAKVAKRLRSGGIFYCKFTAASASERILKIG